MPASVWNPGKTWAAFAAGDGSSERALRRSARGRAGICRGFPGILFRPDFRSQARAWNSGLQHGIAVEALAGNDGRNGAQRLQESGYRERPWRERALASVFRASADGEP